MMTKIVTRTAEFSPLGVSMFLCRMFDNVEVDLDDAEKNFEAMREISECKSYAVLVDARVHISLTKEALEDTARKGTDKNLIANAIVVNSLANRIVGNFKIKLSKQEATTKLFTDYDAALEWLGRAVKKHGHQARTNILSL